MNIVHINSKHISVMPLPPCSDDGQREHTRMKGMFDLPGSPYKRIK